MLYVGEGSKREEYPLLHSLPVFSHYLPLPTIKLCPSGADSWVGEFVYILEPCGSLQQTLLWGWEFLLLPQPPQVFLVRGFKALFPRNGILGCVICLAPQLFLLAYLIHTQMWDCPFLHPLPHLVHQLLPCCESSPPQLPISAPPTCLDEYFFFHSLVVRFPYRSIFCQFWLFFVFKFVVVLLLVVRGGKGYLRKFPTFACFYQNQNHSAFKVLQPFSSPCNSISWKCFHSSEFSKMWVLTTTQYSMG